MLIGPTLTLAKLEEKMNDKLHEIKMNKGKMEKNLRALQIELNQMDKTILNEHGDRISNPKYIELYNQFEKERKELEEIEEMQEFIEEKLQELEDIEERSKGRGNIDKEKDKITLSLNDCLKLGITAEDWQQTEGD
jgi:hypothetical protein